MTSYHVGTPHLARYAMLDLAQGRVEEAGRKLTHLLEHGQGPGLFDVTMLRLFLCLAQAKTAEAANLATYMRLRWGGAHCAGKLAEVTPLLLLATPHPAWAGLAVLPWPTLVDTLVAQASQIVAPGWIERCSGDRPLVVVDITGGLGNQLFQYGVGLSWARRCGGVLRLDIGFYDQVLRDDRRFWLENFNIDAGLASAAELARVDDCHHVQDLAVFDHVAATGRGDVHLTGFWPSHAYVQSVAEELRQAYTPINPHVTAYARAYVNALRGAGRVVAVHVRRGDNTQAYNRNNYLLHPPEFYRQAARRFGPDSVFLVFSDTNMDLEWCRRELGLDYGARVEFSANHSFLFDFALMQECDDHILSVSSFSWWAAYLAERPGQRVVMAAAEQGTGITGAHYRQSERAPPHWEVMVMPPHLCP